MSRVALISHLTHPVEEEDRQRDLVRVLQFAGMPANPRRGVTKSRIARRHAAFHEREPRQTRIADCPPLAAPRSGPGPPVPLGVLCAPEEIDSLFHRTIHCGLVERRYFHRLLGGPLRRFLSLCLLGRRRSDHHRAGHEEREPQSPNNTGFQNGPVRVHGAYLGRDEVRLR